MYKTGWQSVQAVQRLYNWGVQMGLLRDNPVRAVKKPALGQRQRVLSPDEQQRLLDATDRTFRPFLLALLHTIARPQEVRALRWKYLLLEPVPMFVLTDFKAKERRKDRHTAVRRILLDDVMVGLLEELAATAGCGACATGSGSAPTPTARRSSPTRCGTRRRPGPARAACPTASSPT
jgi:integrase